MNKLGEKKQESTSSPPPFVSFPPILLLLCAGWWSAYLQHIFGALYLNWASFQMIVCLSDWKMGFVLTLTFERWSKSALFSQGMPGGFVTSIL